MTRTATAAQQEFAERCTGRTVQSQTGFTYAVHGFIGGDRNAVAIELLDDGEYCGRIVEFHTRIFADLMHVVA